MLQTCGRQRAHCRAPPAGLGPCLLRQLRGFMTWRGDLGFVFAIPLDVWRFGVPLARSAGVVRCCRHLALMAEGRRDSSEGAVTSSNS